MPTKQQIIDAMTPGIVNTNARFLQIKREDAAVLCDIDLSAVASPADVDDELANLRKEKVELEKAKLRKEIAAMKSTPEAPDDEPTELSDPDESASDA